MTGREGTAFAKARTAGSASVWGLQSRPLGIGCEGQPWERGGKGAVLGHQVPEHRAQGLGLWGGPRAGRGMDDWGFT